MRKRVPLTTPFVLDYSLKEISLHISWIDGKPVFRRVIDIEDFANGATLSAAGIIDTLVKVSGFSTINPGQLTQLPFDDGTNFIGTNIVVATGQVNLDRNIVPAAGSFVILEYTKR